MNKKRLAAFGAAVCLAASLAGCGSDKTAVYVQQVSVLSGISSTDKFSAMVVSENITEIKKDSDKDVSELLVKEGQDVKEGDPLFTYDTDQLQLAADKLDLEREQLNSSMSDYDTQIGDLERARDKASADRKLQYTIQIQSLQVSKKEAELNMKTKVAELEKARKLLDNATITSPVTGRIQSVNENGTDSQGNPAAYITIQQAGAYRVKGIIGELQQNALRQGDKVIMTSRVDSSKTWTGTVSQIDYENPVKNDNNGYIMSSSSDSVNQSSKYYFYVELDSMEGLIMGQHLYLQRDSGDGTVSGVPVQSAYICFEDDGSAYVWAEGSHGKLEKRTVTLGEYNEETDLYDVTGGLSETDYIAFPDAELCKPGVAVSHTPVVSEEDGGMSDAGMDGGMQDGGMSDGGMVDGGMDAGMVDGGMADAGMEDAMNSEETQMDPEQTAETPETADSAGELQADPESVVDSFTEAG